MNVAASVIGARPPSSAARADDLRVAVIVPTYRRPQDLARCLEALARQQRQAEQVIVVARAEDEATWRILRAAPARALQLVLVAVRSAGVVAALNAGLDAAAADIVAFTDDDAAPRPDWLRQIVEHFAADPALGGLGGRDWIFQHGRLEDESRQVVGRISWVGRCVGNHHLGAGPLREVDVLKGANMSFRIRALDGVRFDKRLRGSGAQVGNELGVSLAVKRRGWRICYDPRIAVDHYPAVRHDEDRRNEFSAEAVRHAAFNETLLLAEHFGRVRAWAFLGWALLIGDHAAPGVLQWVRLLLIRRDTATRRFLATLSGRFAGWRAAR
jgi:cellulose synthase/poly-beta-1,6-N-acetylglucosamine synthase-like glycosyltransferase